MSRSTMSRRHPGLLPDGFRDVLQPEGGWIEDVRRRLLDSFQSYGYGLVAPPLVEFDPEPGDADLFQGAFRLMDMESQHLMVLRSDITPQIMRLASTRLDAAARPVRLCYGGEVMRSKGTQLRPARQFQQIGAELIGSATLEAEAEVISLGAESLMAAGVDALSIDLTIPTLPGLLLRQSGLGEGDCDAMLDALDRRDAGALAAIDGDDASKFRALIRASGLADMGLAELDTLALPGEAGRLVARMRRLADHIADTLPSVRLTIDPCERRGFSYKTGVAFSFFAVGHAGELGRGGRYSLDVVGGDSETATGFSLYLDRLLDILPMHAGPERVYAPVGTDATQVRALRADGYSVVAGLSRDDDVMAAAQAQSCQWITDAGGLLPVGQENEG